jgi:hypothetical protein
LKFKVAFYFVNTYAVSMMLVYYIVANFLLEHINPEFVQHHYLDLLGKRGFVFFWLLGAFNMAFYFGIGFRFTVGVMLLYTINATFEQFLVIHSTFGLLETPIFSAYALSRPVFMLALLGLLLFYKDG